MNTTDIISKEYLTDNLHFAQVFNGFFFQGHNIIRPEFLRELDSEERLVLQAAEWDPEPEQGSGAEEDFDAGEGADAEKDTKSKKFRRNQLLTLDRQRDVLKIYDDKAILAIVGIEAQTRIHYAMPLRHMVQDSMRYEAQAKQIAQEHERNKDLSGAEYLSRFSRSDQLIPVISICIYWGRKAWDGPKDLHDMLILPPDLLPYKNLIANYRMNLLEVCRIPDLNQYEGEVRALFGVLKYGRDSGKLKDFISENTDLFQHITSSTVQAISVLCNSAKLEKLLSSKQEQTKEEDNHMSDWFQDWMDEEREAGREEGIIEGRKEGKIKEQEELLILYEHLSQNNRQDEMYRAIKDTDYRKTLLAEFNIKQG